MSIAKRNRSRAKNPSQTRLKAEGDDEDEKDEEETAKAEDTEEETTEEEYVKKTSKKSSKAPAAEDADGDGDDDEEDKPAESARTAERQRMAKLRQAFPNDADFAMEAFEQGWSVTKAKAEYCDRLTSGKAKLGGKSADKAGEGVKPLRLAGGSRSGAASSDATDTDTGNAISDFSAAVRERMQAGMKRTDAVKAAARADPELHKAYLLASNPGRRQRELINDHFDLEQTG